MTIPKKQAGQPFMVPWPEPLPRMLASSQGSSTVRVSVGGKVTYGLTYVEESLLGN